MSEAHRNHKPHFTHSTHLTHAKRAAFTLAEVLITLAIIGIVAAMTIPTLIHSYNKKVVETKLVRFNSVMNQALGLSTVKNNGMPPTSKGFGEDSSNESRSETAQTWFQNNIFKHIKSLKDEGTHNYYYWAEFDDGSGFYTYVTAGGDYWIFYCLDFENNCGPENFDGIHSFLFTYNYEKNSIQPAWIDQSRSLCMTSCSNTANTFRHGCIALIAQNNWKIPDDYPWKF